MNEATVRSPAPTRIPIIRALVVVAALLAPPAVQAKGCDLDLQVVLWNPGEAFAADPLGGLVHAATAGFLGDVEEAMVYDFAMQRIRARMEELEVTGRVRQIHAVYSGRHSGWYSWDPASPADPQPTERDSDDFGARWMLAIHLDDPAEAAVRIKNRPAAELALVSLLGADVRGRVYKGVFAAMVPYLEEHGLKVMLNTGLGVPCAKVTQRYDDTTPSGF
ncbi:MAG: hypothetical protein V4850_23690 [Myxococcota bacterium]